MNRLNFEVRPAGLGQWDVWQYSETWTDPVFRQDLSPEKGCEWTMMKLYRLYPGCRVRVNRPEIP